MLTNNKNIYLILWFGCILGALSLVPLLAFTGFIDSHISSTTLALLITGQAAVVFGLVLWVSYLILPKTDLRPFSFSQPWSNIILPGVFWGALVGLILILCDRFLFASSALSGGSNLPFWVCAVASFYGGINEEVLLRLFVLTFIYFLLSKKGQKNRIAYLWIATIVAALIFGLGHLPAASRIIPLNSFEVFHIILLNGIPGVIFGWLYWSKSFYTASLAHFVADILIHALF